MIYLDYAASSPPFSQVVREMGDVALTCFGNPGALHGAGAQARAILHNCRSVLAEATNVRPEEIFFTSGGTEANNWAVKCGCTDPRRRHIVCSAEEHSSVLEPVRRLEKKGYEVTYLDPDRTGSIRLEDVERVLRRDTALLCVQAVNNETGVLQDVGALADAAHAFGARYLCDGVQSFGHVSQDLRKADYISLSAHKFGGPRGVGCLIVRGSAGIKPLIDGGGQEFGLRSGTENLPGIAGMALAARLSSQMLAEEESRLIALRTLLESELKKLAPEFLIAGEGADRSGILCCGFPGISGEEMVMRLDLKGICVSPGAACAARNAEPSHVLLSMGYSPEEAAGFVRFSPGRNTSTEDILETAAAVADIIQSRS